MQQSLKYRYMFDATTGVLFKYYYGPISVEDIKSSWIETFEKNLIPAGTKGFILDYRKAKMAITPDEHIEIARFYKENLLFFGQYRFAILTNNPKDIVIPMLVHEKDEGYESQPFSTEEAAVDWVLRRDV
jgi:hypothetical protein